MLGSFAAETGTDMFDHTTSEAQPPGSHQGPLSRQVGPQALESANSQLRGMENALDESLTQDRRWWR
jgi:hypothetical protein